jgi:tRNA A37 N6-isopentenylltransferase MiaA
MIQYRYVWTKDSPEPSVQTVGFDELWQHLPEGTPRIDPEQRREQIAVRQRAIARRTRA